MELIDRDGLAERLNRLDEALTDPLDLILVGGAAVVALVKGAEATRDIDLIRTTGFDKLSRSPEGRAVIALSESLGVSARSDGFEVYLPERWRERSREMSALAGERIRVFVPRPEDLAVMKVFRFHAKDQADIELLTSLPDFDIDLFRTGFLDALHASIGHPRFPAQSFMMVWNVLQPDRAMTVEGVLESAGLTSTPQGAGLRGQPSPGTDGRSPPGHRGGGGRLR